MNSLKSLKSQFEGKRIHILGVAGTLMGAFAAYLKKQGIAVTGSDQNIYPPMSGVLAAAGVEVYAGYKAENLDAARPDLVIVGNVISRGNPEMVEVVRRGLKFLSLPAAFETMILPQKHSLVVAGTHGKTTTVAMMAHILETLGEKPSFFIGGVPQDFAESFRVTDSRYMVLEGDEYDTAYFDKVPKFVHYRPRDAILTSVEFDHADIYTDIHAVTAAFEKLAALVPPEGHMIVCGESELALRVAHGSRATVVSYGFTVACDARGEKLVLDATGARFQFDGVDVRLPLGGRHNALNALSCLALCRALELDVEKAALALSRFKGIKRRQEVYGEARGITIIDDFAHHPTAVRETLAAVKSKYPGRRLVACFEPRSATSRRKIFQQDYAVAFDVADEVLIAKPYDQSSIDPAQQFSTEELLADIKARRKEARVLATDENSVKALSRTLKNGDVVLVMTNGGFDGFHGKLLAALKA